MKPGFPTSAAVQGFRGRALMTHPLPLTRRLPRAPWGPHDSDLETHPSQSCSPPCHPPPMLHNQSTNQFKISDYRSHLCGRHDFLASLEPVIPESNIGESALLWNPGSKARRHHFPRIPLVAHLRPPCSVWEDIWTLIKGHSTKDLTCTLQKRRCHDRQERLMPLQLTGD